MMILWQNVKTQDLKNCLGAALVNQEMMEFFLFTLCTKCVENPGEIIKLVSLAENIIKDPQYSYGSKKFQLLVVKFSSGVLGEMNDETFKVVLLKLFEHFLIRELITKLSIIEIWLRICNDLKYKWNLIPKFLQTIKEMREFVKVLNKDEEIVKIVAVRNYLKLKQKHESLQKFKKNFDDAIEYFDRLLIGKTVIPKVINQPSTKKSVPKNQNSKFLTPVERKLIVAKIINLFNSTEKMKNNLKSLNTNKAEAKEVLETFSMIAVDCLEESQVKPYVERIMKDLERENYAGLVMKLLKNNLIQQAQKVKIVKTIKNFSILTEEIHKRSKISVEDLVKILKALATTQNIEDSFQALPFFIKKFRNFFNFQSLPKKTQECFIEIYRIVENVKNQGVHYEHQKNLQEILILLNIPIQPPNPDSIINTELSFDYLPRGEDGVNILFENFVKSFSRQKVDKPVDIRVFYLEEEARYFVKNAITSETAANKFGSIFPSLQDTPSMKLLLEKIVEVTEEKFSEQHNHKTQSESLKIETRSIFVLLMNMVNIEIISPERFVELAYIIFHLPQFSPNSLHKVDLMVNHIKFMTGMRNKRILGGIT